MTTSAPLESFKLEECPLYRYELRTVNGPAWPSKPAHPRLIRDFTPQRQPDGTFGDCDYLYAPYPFQRKRIWIHYIPSPGMWRESLNGSDAIPIFIKPNQYDPKYWESSIDGHAGRFASRLCSNLRNFHDAALAHALRLHQTAREYVHLPLYGDHLDWQGLEKGGKYQEMLALFVDLQRSVAELYGWIFLQEKLQPDVPSIVPNRPPLQYQGHQPPIDQFVGVIVDWNDRSPDFDAMAMQHGLILWWVDYSTPGSNARPPWRGLALGHEAVAYHRGSGFIPLRKDVKTRNFIMGSNPVTSAPPPNMRTRPQPQRSLGSRDKKRPLSPGPSQSGPTPASSLLAPSASASRGPTEPSGKKRIRDMTAAELQALKEEGAARRAELERQGLAKPRDAKAKRRAKNKSAAERRLARIARGEPAPGDLEPRLSPSA